MMNRKHLIIPLILMVICVSLLYKAYTDVESRTIEELHSEQMVHAKQSANGLKIFFDNYETVLNYFASIAPVKNLDNEGQKLLAHFYTSHSNEIKAVTRIDASGKIIFTFPYDTSLIGKSIAYQKHVNQLIHEHKPLLSSIFYSVQGYRAVALYVPVFDKNAFAGGLAILIPFDKLTGKYVKEIHVRDNGFAWVVSNSGNILYHPDPDFTDKPVKYVLNDTMDRAKVMKGISNGSSDRFTSKLVTSGSSRVEMCSDFYTIRVNDKYWSVIVSTPREEIFKTMRGFLINWLSVFSLLLGLSIYFMYYTGKARTIIKEEAKRRKAEEALSNSERKFRTLVDVIPDGIMLIDTDGRILTSNPKANELLGYAVKDRALFGKNIKDFIALDDKQKAMDAINGIRSSGLIKHIEYTLTKTDGTEFHAEVSFASIPIKDGKKENITVVIRDITERKLNEKAIIEAKDKAERSDQLKSEFLAQMSHEIRSPINSILSFTSLIKDELIDKVSEDLKISFSIIENAGKRIIRTIGLILNMSEIQTGSFEVLLRKIDLNKEILNKVYLEYRQTAKDKGLELYYKNECPDSLIYADEYTVGQIFSNLVDNAIKYTEKGEINLTVCRRESGEVIVEVRDSGIGISEEYLPNLFSPFSQEEQGYTRKYEGNGLGLALVKKYCDINNIKIEVESRKGDGSVFRIILQEYV